MHVLVVGLRDLDAGKTTLARGLVDLLVERGVDVVPWKPWSASSLWQHHDAVVRALEEDLASRDARRLLAAAGRDADPRLVNPVHRVWRPRSALESGRGNTVPLLDRVAAEDGVTWVVHGDGDLPRPLPDLVAGAERVEEASDDEALRSLQASLHVPAVEAAWERAEAAGDWTLTESYSDVARPPGLAAVPDVAVAVEPGRVHRFDGPRWDKALDLRSGVRAGSTAEPAAGDLLDLVSPERSADLPPLTDDQQADAAAVAEAYRRALEDVLPEAGGGET